MTKRSLSNQERIKINSVLNYQFGVQRDWIPMDEPLEVTISGSTKRIRHVYSADEMLLTLNPSSGLFIPSLLFAERILIYSEAIKNRVVAHNDAIDFVAKGKTLFCKHVTALDMKKVVKDEIVVTDTHGSLIATGSLLLPPALIIEMESGAAVKVRKGISQKNK